MMSTAPDTVIFAAPRLLFTSLAAPRQASVKTRRRKELSGALQH